MGVERSVSLQFCDANFSTDAANCFNSIFLDSTLATGYTDPEMLADVFGSLQTTSKIFFFKFCYVTTILIFCLFAGLTNNCNDDLNKNSPTSSITFECTSDVSKSESGSSLTTNTTTKSNNKTYNSNCFITCSNSSNTSLSDINISPTISGQIMDLNNRGNSNSNSSSSSSSSSNSSSSSSYSNNGSEILANISVPGFNPPIIVKKLRSKTTSPTRHGPQQCQVDIIFVLITVLIGLLYCNLCVFKLRYTLK